MKSTAPLPSHHRSRAEPPAAAQPPLQHPHARRAPSARPAGSRPHNAARRHRPIQSKQAVPDPRQKPAVRPQPLLDLQPVGQPEPLDTGQTLDNAVSDHHEAVAVSARTRAHLSQNLATLRHHTLARPTRLHTRPHPRSTRTRVETRLTSRANESAKLRSSHLKEAPAPARGLATARRPRAARPGAGLCMPGHTASTFLQPDQRYSGLGVSSSARKFAGRTGRCSERRGRCLPRAGSPGRCRRDAGG